MSAPPPTPSPSPPLMRGEGDAPETQHKIGRISAHIAAVSEHLRALEKIADGERAELGAVFKFCREEADETAVALSALIRDRQPRVTGHE